MTKTITNTKTAVDIVIENDGASDPTCTKEEILKAADRLEELSDFLCALEQNDFNMGGWSTPKDDGPYRSPDYCKTACCIGGWSTLFHPDLKWIRGGICFGDFRAYAAFIKAFCLNSYVGYALTHAGAEHQTPDLAAIEVCKVVAALRRESHG